MLSVHSWYFGDGGFPRHAQGLVRALAARGVDIALAHDTTPPRDAPPSLEEARMLARGVASRSPDVALGIGPFELMPTLIGRVKIASVVWETTRIPVRQLSHLRGVDEIWTPTAWGRDLLVANGVPASRVAVVPEGIDPHAFTPADPIPALGPNGRFRFLTVGKWEERKATRELVRAFAEAFGPDDPVELYLHAWNPMQPDADLDADVRRATNGRHAPILTGRRVDDAALLALYRGAQAFLLPSRGEGWGLPILESMACGLPAIVTDYSGHRAFASECTGYLVRVAGMCDVNDPMFFQGGDFGHWAQPDFGHLREILRHVATHPDEARARGALARAQALRWTWDHAAEVALERLAHWGIGPQ